MVYAIGLMSGTSLDGVDAALVDIHGVNEETSIELVEFITLPFSDAMISKIRQSFSLKHSHSALISSLNVELGAIFAEAALEVTREANIPISQINFIASHGQTIYHIPKKTEDWQASTLQIGEPAVIAEITGCKVVSNFRTRDMAVGGQGAPIVPYSEYILYRHPTRMRLLQNIGGIGNMTIIPPKADLDELLAFDTGPGNMIMNEMVQIFYGEEYDKNGEYAQRGEVNEELLDEWLAHPYFKLEPPKTTGRELFGVQFVREYLDKYELSPNDWIATSTMFTAQTIAHAAREYAMEYTDLIIGGGGSYNETLVQFIKKLLPKINVWRQEDMGFSSDAKEAIAMVILGNQTLHKQPNNVPSATGAQKAVILGSVTY